MKKVLWPTIWLFRQPHCFAASPCGDFQNGLGGLFLIVAGATSPTDGCAKMNYRAASTPLTVNPRPVTLSLFKIAY
jgi:hypothetical protein